MTLGAPRSIPLNKQPKKKELQSTKKKEQNQRSYRAQSLSDLHFKGLLLNKFDPLALKLQKLASKVFLLFLLLVDKKKKSHDFTRISRNLTGIKETRFGKNKP